MLLKQVFRLPDVLVECFFKSAQPTACWVNRRSVGQLCDSGAGILSMPFSRTSPAHPELQQWEDSEEFATCLVVTGNTLGHWPAGAMTGVLELLLLKIIISAMPLPSYHSAACGPFADPHYMAAQGMRVLCVGTERGE